MKCCYINVHFNSVNYASISRKNFMNFGLVTPELIKLTYELLVRHGKKLAYPAEYLRIYSTNYYNLFTVSKRFVCR